MAADNSDFEGIICQLLYNSEIMTLSSQHRIIPTYPVVHRVQKVKFGILSINLLPFTAFGDAVVNELKAITSNYFSLPAPGVYSKGRGQPSHTFGA